MAFLCVLIGLASLLLRTLLLSLNGRSPPLLLNIEQIVNNLAYPKGYVGRLSQVTHWLFRAPDLALPFAQQVAERNEKPAVPLPLVAREGQDAGQVVANVAILLLAEIADGVGPDVVDLTQHVENERVYVEVEGFVVQEELRKVCEVLAVGVGDGTVHLEHAQIPVSVYFIPRRVRGNLVGDALALLVVQQASLVEEERERVLAQVQRVDVLAYYLLGVGGEVPRFDLELAEGNFPNIFDLLSGFVQ